MGCGWLGLPLAKELLDDGYKVKGSTTSLDKIPHLKSVGIDAFHVELKQDTIIGDIENCLFGSAVLILNIPPGLRKHPEADFVKQMSFLVPYIEKSSIGKVIFVSSTSVFRDEESIPVITENTVPNTDTESGKQLFEVEKMLQSNKHFSTTVLRFSGLFGPNRHPANYLSDKVDVKNPDAPVNLIHLDDCIGIIQNIIQKNLWNETFNASTTPHLSRKTYYTSVCRAMNLPLPLFEQISLSTGKCIDSEKLLRLLDYDFKVKLNN